VAGGVIGARRFYRRAGAGGMGPGHYCARRALVRWQLRHAAAGNSSRGEPVGLAVLDWTPWLVAMAPKQAQRRVTLAWSRPRA